MTSPIAPDVLISADRIVSRIEELSDDIVLRCGARLTVVPILTGAYVFAADLTRALWHRRVDLSVSPIRLQSYGAARAAEDAPVLTMGLGRRVEGETILLVDGVCDVGHTLQAAQAHALESGAARVMSVVMIDKPTRRSGGIAPDFVGFTVEDVFVAGYGMDAGGALRHLPYIGVVR